MNIVKISNTLFSGVPKEKIKQLISSLETLPIPVPVPDGKYDIEVFRNPLRLHGFWGIKRIKREYPDYNPETINGEFCINVTKIFPLFWKKKTWLCIRTTRIILYQRAFADTPQKTLYITLHEMGHYATRGGEKEANEWAKKICPSYDLDEKKLRKRC